jgi:hypothetical protein
MLLWARYLLLLALAGTVMLYLWVEFVRHE